MRLPLHIRLSFIWVGHVSYNGRSNVGRFVGPSPHPLVTVYQLHREHMSRRTPRGVQSHPNRHIDCGSCRYIVRSSTGMFCKVRHELSLDQPSSMKHRGGQAASAMARSISVNILEQQRASTESHSLSSISRFPLRSCVQFLGEPVTVLARYTSCTWVIRRCCRLNESLVTPVSAIPVCLTD